MRPVFPLSLAKDTLNFVMQISTQIHVIVCVLLQYHRPLSMREGVLTIVSDYDRISSIATPPIHWPTDAAFCRCEYGLASGHTDDEQLRPEWWAMPIALCRRVRHVQLFSIA